MICRKFAPKCEISLEPAYAGSFLLAAIGEALSIPAGAPQAQRARLPATRIKGIITAVTTN